VAGSFRPNEHHRAASELSAAGTPGSSRVEPPSHTWHPRARAVPGPAAPVADVRVHIDSDRAIVEARRQARRLAAAAGFKPTDLTIIATVISELARNMLLFAKSGEIAVGLIHQGARKGVVVTATDGGPGIPDVARALEDGYSTAGRLGLGLPGAKRLVDDFEITSAPDAGTTVVARKWSR
jgi:serine/threonine-protein kinase RsbT